MKMNASCVYFWSGSRCSDIFFSRFSLLSQKRERKEDNDGWTSLLEFRVRSEELVLLTDRQAAR